MGKGKRLKQDRTGLRAMTKDQHEDFYMRWRDVMKAVTMRGGFLIVSDEHQPYFNDLLERLKEDAWWKLQPVGQSDPMMMFHKAIPYHVMQIWTPDGRLQTPTEFFGNVGLGRYSGFGMASKDQRPWGEDPA